VRREAALLRTFLLYMCLALFFTRVVAQVEVLLLAPNYLPDMAAWYSGILPYPLLLPMQILLLMGMSVLVAHARSAKPLRHGYLWRTLAVLYFAVMAVRLVICVAIHGSEFYLHGAIPIAFHWVLALFALSYVGKDGDRPRWPPL
jgi:hypothetical protein